MASKNKQQFYRENDNFHRKNHQLEGVDNNTQNNHNSHASILKENLRSLEIYSKPQITLSLILRYMNIFFSKRIKYILFASIALGIAYCGVYFYTKSFTHNIQGNLLIFSNFVSKWFLLLVGAIIGMGIMREAILTRQEKKGVSFFLGFTPFMSLHIIMNLLIFVVASISILFTSMLIEPIHFSEKLYDNIISMVGIISTSLVSSLFLTRFSILIPALIYKDTDNYNVTLQRMIPFFRPLFISLFSIKLICLSVFITSDVFLLHHVAIIPKVFCFIVYNIFVYALLGVSFKLYHKFG